MNNPYQPISLEKAARIAERRNARRRRKYPLFADRLPVVTAEQVQAEFQRHHDRFEEALRRLSECAEQLRGMVASLVNDQELRRLDERREVLPRGEEYAADYWRHVYLRLVTEKGG
jgi:hypothetical protein